MPKPFQTKNLNKILAAIVVLTAICAYSTKVSKEAFSLTQWKLAQNDIEKDQKIREHDLYNKRHEIYAKSQGWWEDVRDCEQSGALTIYCKPKEMWVWPY